MGWNQLQNNPLPSIKTELSCSFISSTTSRVEFILVHVMDFSETSPVLDQLAQSLELLSQSTLSLSNESEQILYLNGVQISECTYSHLSRRE